MTKKKLGNTVCYNIAYVFFNINLKIFSFIAFCELYIENRCLPSHRIVLFWFGNNISIDKGENDLPILIHLAKNDTFIKVSYFLFILSFHFYCKVLATVKKKIYAWISWKFLIFLFIVQCFLLGEIFQTIWTKIITFTLTTLFSVS